MTRTKEYGTRFLYSEDLIVDGELKSPVMEIVKYHPPGTLKPEGKKEAIAKPSIEFQGKTTKILTLCRTNELILHQLTGYSRHSGEKWVGAKVHLQVRVIDSFNREEVAIRIMPVNGMMVRKVVRERLGAKAQYTIGKGFHK